MEEAVDSERVWRRVRGVEVRGRRARVGASARRAFRDAIVFVYELGKRWSFGDVVLLPRSPIGRKGSS